jgi:hypothetical protein
MPTPTEKRITQERRAWKSGSILTPIMEQLLEDEVRADDEEDYRFLAMLARARAVPREKGVFSPSMLGSCIRQAFFAKTGEEKHRAQSPQTNGYFLKGDFVHLQWQFALWKAHRKGLLELVSVAAENKALDFYGDGTRPGVEIRVRSEAGDFAGTIDAIVRINGVYYAIDFKGINLIDFQRSVRHGAKDEYRVQIVGYAMIVNGSDKFEFRIKKCLLIYECKAGPQLGSGGSPIALHETVVDVDDHKLEVRDRLKRLRDYVAEERIPPPACVSTRHNQFQECPFNRFCLTEVKQRQREAEKKAQARARSKKLTVARPRR